MNDKPETKIGYISPLKRICMTIGELPTSYLETMSYYEMLVWFVEFLKNQIIPVVNNNSEATEELQHLFIELQSYVNNYFDNLDVQEEINNKLDEMVEDGTLTELINNYIVPIINEQNIKISALENQVQSVASGSPLVASSTSEMTDTSRVYVNTSDGYWYYYNGSTWERGGVYQSTGIGIGEVNTTNVEFHKRGNNLFNYDNSSIVNMTYSTSTNLINSSPASTTIVIPVTPNTKYAIYKTIGNRFNVWGTENYPEVGATALNPSGNFNATTNQHIIYETSDSTNYLCFFCHNQGAEPNTSRDSVLRSVMISESDSYLPYENYYNLNITEKDLPDKLNINKLNKIPLTENNCDNIIKTPQLINLDNINIVNLIPSNDENLILTNSPTSYTLVLPVTPNTTYAIQKLGGGARFCVWGTKTYPMAHNKALNMFNNAYTHNASIKSCVYTTDANTNYLCVFFYNSNADVGLNLNEALNGLMINLGSTYEALTTYYKIEEDYTNNYTNLSMFNNICCIGDSYTQGAFFMHDEWFNGNEYGLSYPDFIAKRNNINVLNCGVGGSTTRTWLTSPNGLSKVLSNTPKDLYYLGLGINDAHQLGTSYLGTINDINEDYTQNPDTFYGNYGKIIAQIKNHAPYTKMIMIGCMRPNSMSANYGIFTNAIKDIANHFNIPFINPFDDNFFTSSIMSTLSNYHPTPAGYNGISKAIERLTSKAINNNSSYFLDSNYQTINS